MKNKLLVRSLDVVGVTLLAVAAVLAWQTYFPPEEPLPPDFTIITKDTPADVFPQSVNTSPAIADDVPAAATPSAEIATPAAATLPPPLTLPSFQGKATDDNTTVDPSVDAVKRPVARKHDQNWLDDLRAQPFPPPADAAPERLFIPSINVDSSIKEVGWKQSEQNGQVVTEWEVADYAVSFHQGTALPGHNGNTVMSGHNNYKGQVFRNLVDVKVNDEIFVFVGEVAYRYQVTQRVLVKEKDATFEERLKNATWINPTKDMRLTLVSCWPYATNTHRIIIVAKPAPAP